MDHQGRPDFSDLVDHSLVVQGRRHWHARYLSGPMDMAFLSDGRTALVGNQGDGTISIVDLGQGVVVRTIRAGDGVESLAFF